MKQFQVIPTSMGDMPAFQVAVWAGDGWTSVQAFSGPDSEQAALETCDKLNSVLDAARTVFASSTSEGS